VEGKMWDRATDKDSGLTHARVRELFRYNPFTGSLIRRVSITGKAMKGTIAGSFHKSSGYLVLGIDRRKTLFHVHRLIWFYMTGRWPISQVDHIDRNQLNNKWTNLREANNGQSKLNTRLNRNNTSGVRGVHFHSSEDIWMATISIDGKRKFLGRFETFEEAAAVRMKAEKEIYGEFSTL